MPNATITHPDPAEAGQAAEKVVIPVTGMTCAACQGRVQRTLSKTPGVVDASVNLMMNNATVSYDPAARDAAQEKEFRELRAKAMVSGVAGAVAMALSMPLMAGDHAHGVVADPFMRWAMGSLTPALRAAAPWLYSRSLVQA